MAVEPTLFQRINTFSNLSQSALTRLAEVAVQVNYVDRQTVILEGDPVDWVYFVLDGIVRIYRMNLEGREQNLIQLETGEAFNLPTAFSDEKGAPASAVVVGRTALLGISFDNLRKVSSETPEIALAILRDLSKKLHHLTELTYDLSLRSVRARLARFLLTQARLEEPEILHWTHEEIAAQIGSVREVVGRTLRAFVREGLLKVERQRICIYDLEGLEREAAM